LLGDLAQGNGTQRRIIAVDPRDLGLLTDGAGSAPPQRPFAAVLGCADARVPIELIFNEGPNDLFVVRVAGNGLGDEVRGSLRYAVDHLGDSLKMIVVLGHSGCGAVSAAAQIFFEPHTYLGLATQHALRGILDRLLGVIHSVDKRMQSEFGLNVVQQPGYRAALVEASVVLNAALAAYTLQQDFGLGADKGLRATYGAYLIGTRRVWAPRADSDDCDGLAELPPDMRGFGRLIGRLVHSERIRAILANAVG
jgi:carbonic anhydrase